MFLIAICRQSDDGCQSKTLFLTIFDLRLSIVLTFSFDAYPVCSTKSYVLSIDLDWVTPTFDPHDHFLKKRESVGSFVK